MQQAIRPLPMSMFQFFCKEHAYGWSIDEDGIDYGCPQCISEDLPLVCGWCDLPCDNLTVVEDSDSNVGYSGDPIEACDTCLATNGKGR